MSKPTSIDAMKQQLAFSLNNYYQNIAVSVFEWKSEYLWEKQKMRVPKRQPEKLLYENGLSTLFKLEGTDTFLMLPVAQEQIQKNAYGEPSQWRAMALGNLAGPVSAQVLTPENAVLFRNDDTYTPLKPYVKTLVDQLINVEWTLRLNINAQKVPFVVKSSQRSIISDKHFASKVLECDPLIFLDNMMAEGMEAVDFGIACKMAELNDAYNVYDQRILEYLGVDCVARDKKERLTAEEGDANDEKIDSVKKVRLEQRQLGVQLARELWPDELSDFDVKLADHVMMARDAEKEDMQEMKKQMQEGDDAGRGS